MRALIIVAALLSGCVKQAEQSQQVNGEFKVDTLFTKDGCTVYRFYDGGFARYFTNCGSTHYQTPSGKSSRPDGVATAAPPEGKTK